jgi:hypothetical protein
MVIASFGIIGGSDILPRLVSLHDLATSNRVTQGTIIDTYPREHMTCKYRYSVDERSYEGIGRDCGDAIVGEQINVYFSPADPRKSLNLNPGATFSNDLGAFVAALIILPMFGAIIGYIRARRSSAT